MKSRLFSTFQQNEVIFLFYIFHYSSSGIILYDNERTSSFLVDHFLQLFCSNNIIKFNSFRRFHWRRIFQQLIVNPKLLTELHSRISFVILYTLVYNIIHISTTLTVRLRLQCFIKMLNVKQINLWNMSIKPSYFVVNQESIWYSLSSEWFWL